MDRNGLGAVLVQAGLGSPRDHVLISLLAVNGLCISEALGTDIETWTSTAATAPCGSCTKAASGPPPRWPPARRALDLYIGARTTGPIFVGAGGGRMDRYAADRTVKRLARRAGITKRISPHSLRHSFIGLATRVL